MAKRSVTIELIPLTPPAGEVPRDAESYFGPKRHFLEVEVAYTVGGLNYFSGGTTPRGYHLRATPIWKETSTSGGESTGFTMFSGHALLLEPATRFSAATLAKVAAAAASHPHYENLKTAVLASSKRTLAPAA